MQNDDLKPFLQIEYRKFNEKVPGCLVSVVGLLVSLWADCITTVACTQEDRYAYIEDNMYISKTIIQTYHITHFMVVISCTAGLILGLKEKNRSLLLPWLLVKILELITFAVGCLFLATNARQYYICVMPVGIIFCLIGAYITVCVGLTYKKMGESPNVSTCTTEDVDIDIPEESLLASCRTNTHR